MEGREGEFGRACFVAVVAATRHDIADSDLFNVLFLSGWCLLLLVSVSSVRHFTVLKCDKAEAKSWDEVWKSGEVDKNQDSLQNTQKDVSRTTDRETNNSSATQSGADERGGHGWVLMLFVLLAVGSSQVHLKGGCRFLKLRIDSGYEEFAAVYEVRVEGSA